MTPSRQPDSTLRSEAPGARPAFPSFRRRSSGVAGRRSWQIIAEPEEHHVAGIRLVSRRLASVLPELGPAAVPSPGHFRASPSRCARTFSMSFMCWTHRTEPLLARFLALLDASGNGEAGGTWPAKVSARSADTYRDCLCGAMVHPSRIDSDLQPTTRLVTFRAGEVGGQLTGS